jgi:hypothetical protein
LPEELLRHHRGGGLGDGASLPTELHVVHHDRRAPAAADPDLVATGGIVHVNLGVGVGDLAAVPGFAVVLQDHLLVQRLERGVERSIEMLNDG